MKLNCWEIKECGRQPGGEKVDELGVCPAAVHVESDGINQGAKAGRYCWRIAGTYCSDKVQGVFADKAHNCGQCDVFRRILREEGPDFTL